VKNVSEEYSMRKKENRKGQCNSPKVKRIQHAIPGHQKEKIGKVFT
jgi:hypothetical protein